MQTAVAGDVIKRVGLGDIFGTAADDDGDFAFPVELGRAAGLFDLVVGAAQAVIGLDENDRFGRNGHSDFRGVVAVIEADGDEFGHATHRGADPRLAADGRERGCVEGRDLRQRGRRKGFARRDP